MKKYVLRLFSAILALVMLSGCLIACDNGSADTDDTTASAETAPAVEAPKLTGITLDSGETVAFDADTNTYTVSLPDGRPRIPRVSATAEAGAEVNVIQATFADDKDEAKAKIEVTGESGENVYEIIFTKDASKGFELQFDDRYTYAPTYTLAEGETFTFESSDPTVVSVDESGVMTAEKRSTDPVNITAKVGGEVKETLTVNKVNKAQLAVFLIVGQSNAAGSSDPGVDRSKEAEESDKPTVGKAYCLEVVYTGSYGRPYDLSEGRVGFSPALSKTWYELTGEKVLCIQSAMDGAPIESWEKGGDPFFLPGSKNLYDNTLAAYNGYKKRFGSNFEIVRTHYYWCQGETAMSSTWYGEPDYNWSFNIGKSEDYIMPANDYYAKFAANHANFVADMGVEIGAIMLVRAIESVSSAENRKNQTLADLVPARAAQYALNNTNGDGIVLASRISDIARMESFSDKNADGWGYMGPGNLHYLQRGYNAQGAEMAKNTFAIVDAYADRSAKSIEVLDTDGVTKLNDDDKITVKSGETKQITSIVLPLYAEDKKITYTVTEGAEYCSIDIYGMISIAENAVKDATAQITIENESGLKHTLNIVVG